LYKRFPEVPASLLVTDPAQLTDATASFAGLPAIALDTEFMRERTYYARLCLLQLAGRGRIALVDPLAITDLSPVAALLGDTAQVKILHAARQDLEVLYPLLGGVAAPVFDTQIAAALLGHPAQMGYGELVAKITGIVLTKGHARTDWARRPLSPEQLHYAADDVRHLETLRDELGTRLDALGRLPWLQEDCRALQDPALYVTEPERAWQRFKGADRLVPQERAALRALAAWREARAMRRNLPRGWILTDETLRDAARLRPALLGLASGGLFALAAIGFRAAIVALGDAPFYVRSTVTLATTLGIQTALLSAWLLARTPAVLAEILFAQAASRRLFAQRMSAREGGGIALMVAGVLMLLNA
jgi:ribonuclease D